MYMPQYTEADRIVIADKQSGEVKVWIKASARLREFHKMYPMDQGYILRVTSKPASDVFGPDVLEVYKAAATAGASFEALGLRPLRLERVFVAQLLDANDRVIREASASGVVGAYKDHERIETAAVQRLLALCGLPGGDEIDEAERSDITEQGGQVMVSQSDPRGKDGSDQDQASTVDPAPRTASPKPARKSAASKAKVQPEGEGEQLKPDEPDARMPPDTAPTWTPAPSSSTGNGPHRTGVLDKLKRQVELAYTAKGLGVPTITTKEEAASALRALKTPTQAAEPNG